MSEAYHDLTVSEEIDGITYTSTKLPTTKGLKIMARTVAMVGESGLRAIVVGSKVVQSMIRGAGPNVLSAAVEVAENLGRDPGFPLDLLTGVKCSALRPAGEGPINAQNFEAHFRGEYMHLLGVCEFVLKHNFTGFTLGSHSTDGSPSSQSEKTSTDDPSS